MSLAGRSTGSLNALERALDVLEAFSAAAPQLGLVEIAKILGVPKSSVFRYLFVLEKRGYVQRAADGRYSLSVKFLGMGNLVRTNLRVADVALPFLQELRAQHGETVNLAILERGEVVHVDVLEGLYGVKMTSPIGSRAPAHSTSLGKAMLAFSAPEMLDEVIERHGLRSLTDRTITSKAALLKDLEQVRLTGFAVDDSESEQGLHCIGAPLFDNKEQVVAAISISGPSLRMQKVADDIARDVRRCAASISRNLGAKSYRPDDQYRDSPEAGRQLAGVAGEVSVLR